VSVPPGVAGRSLVVDARGLWLSGIGRYLREVLAGVLADARFARVTLLGHPGGIADFLATTDATVEARVVSFPHHFYSPGAELHWAVLRARGELRADAAFFPHYDVPLPGPLPPSVVTVHDLAHLRLPELFPAWKRALAGVVLGSAMRRATRVVTISEFTRDDLLARHPAARRKVEVIPQGVAGELAARAASEGARRWADALGPFVLCVGNQKPHKNLRAAVEVLAALRPEWPELRLVVAGKRYPGADDLAEHARALGVDGALREVGAVDDDHLRALYGRAECLLFPSRFEGFGLPVLEAMACGLPVVASNRAAIPEAVGDAGLLVDPEDRAAMADSVRRLREPALRAEMVRRGRARAASLPWAATAARTADLLCAVAGGARGAARAPELRAAS